MTPFLTEPESWWISASRPVFMHNWRWPGYIWTNCTLLASRFTQTWSYSGISNKWDTKQRSRSFTKPYDDISSCEVQILNWDAEFRQQLKFSCKWVPMSRLFRYFCWPFMFDSFSVIIQSSALPLCQHAVVQHFSTIFGKKAITKEVIRNSHKPTFRWRLAKIQLLLQS